MISIFPEILTMTQSFLRFHRHHNWHSASPASGHWINNTHSKTNASLMARLCMLTKVKMDSCSIVHFILSPIRASTVWWRSWFIYRKLSTKSKEHEGLMDTRGVIGIHTLACSTEQIYRKTTACVPIYLQGLQSKYVYLIN